MSVNTFIFFPIVVGAQGYPSDDVAASAIVPPFNTTGLRKQFSVEAGNPLSAEIINIINQIFDADCDKVDAAMNGKYLFNEQNFDSNNKCSYPFRYFS